MARELEELQESDVIFPDNDHQQLDDDACPDDREMAHQNTRLLRKNKSKISRNFEKRMASSLPVNIPDRIYRHEVSDDLEEARGNGDMEPPHLITGRRIAGQMAFSVCTGNGRTLKGRDLSKVRNSILRMTGFLET